MKTHELSRWRKTLFLRLHYLHGLVFLINYSCYCFITYFQSVKHFSILLLQLIPVVWSHGISWHSWAVFVNLKCWQRVLSYQQFSMSGFWWKERTSSVWLTINKRFLYNTLGLWMQPSYLLCHFVIKVIDICGIEISYDYIKITVWPKE